MVVFIMGYLEGHSIEIVRSTLDINNSISIIENQIEECFKSRTPAAPHPIHVL